MAGLVDPRATGRLGPISTGDKGPEIREATLGRLPLFQFAAGTASLCVETPPRKKVYHL